MPYSTQSLNHRPVFTSFSTGPTTGFADNFEASLTRQRDIESAFGMETRLRNSILENLERARTGTGAQLELPPQFDPTSLDALSAAISRSEGRDPYSMVLPRRNTDAFLREYDTLDNYLGTLKNIDPSIKTLTELMEDEKKYRKETIEATDKTFGRASLGGMAGALAGGILGSADPIRDPLLFASFFVGGGGASIARRLLAEAFIGGAAEGVQQGAFVLPRHRELDEPTTSLAASIMFGALGAAAFRGVFEVPYASGYRALERQLNPQRAAARLLRDSIEESLGRPFSFAELETRPTPSQLREGLGGFRGGTVASDADFSLRMDEALMDQSPYPQTREGRLATEEELKTALRDFEGLQGTTTARLEPEEGAIRFEQTVARTEEPELYGRLARVETELKEAEEVLTQAKALKSVGEVVDTENADLGRQIKAIEKKLDGDLPYAKRLKLEQQLDELLEDYDPPKVERLVNAFNDPRRLAARQAGAKVKALREEAIRLRKEAARTESDVAKRAGTGPKPRAVIEVDLERLAREAEEAVKRLPEVADNIVPRIEEDATTVRLNFGGTAERDIPLDLMVEFAEGNFTVRQILDDFADNEAMVAATKECGL